MFGFIAKLVGGPIVKAVMKPIGDWLTHKQNMKALSRQTEMAIVLKKQELLNTQATADIDWDKTMARASTTSWKDEFWTVLLSIPVVLVFIPDMAPYIADGFVVLKSDVPDWYKAALGIAIGAAFGRNELAKYFQSK